MTRYLCWDYDVDYEIEAETAEDAAQEYVDSGDWGERLRTSWVHVRVRTPDQDRRDGEEVRVTLDPDEPDCADEDGHDWQQPVEIVGGLQENPGVHGHGGGVRDTYVCVRCGCRRTYDTWAQDPENGEQGLDATEYEPECYAEEIRNLHEDEDPDDEEEEDPDRESSPAPAWDIPPAGEDEEIVIVRRSPQPDDEEEAE